MSEPRSPHLDHRSPPALALTDAYKARIKEAKAKGEQEKVQKAEDKKAEAEGFIAAEAVLRAAEAGST